MKIKPLFLFFFSIISIAFFSLLIPKLALAASYSVQGTVKDNSSNAIVGAEVDIYSQGTTTDVVPPTTTDTSGNYSFANIPEGVYDVKVIPISGYYSATALNQNITTNTTLNFILVNTGTPITLSGHIYDSLGSPAVNQQVTLSSGSNTYTIATDSNGVYSLQATPDSYSLTITSPGNNGNNPSATNLPQHYQLYVGSSLISPLNQNVTGLDITIPAKKVVVHVQDSSNAAISGVEVDSNYIAESNLPAGSNYSASGQSAYLSSSYGFAPAKTDSTGDATLWLFPTEYPSSGYNLTAVPPAGSIYSTSTASNVVVSDNTTVTITLQN